ncbi:MAG: MurT ligase domain-containing protein [Propionibacteriaceae bacterium]|jgi:UDP-N-acetylmuramyl pentapeptide synthase|nr:MurT ligase domain-containing protein [Propionibacteriaceae bacterium]
MRFLIALWAAKLAARVLRLLGRGGTHVPGRVALAICPDFLRRIDKPARVIAVTGSNGKTTVTNLIADALAPEGAISNRQGANLDAGLAALLASTATLTGGQRVDIGVFEVDERSSERVYSWLTPEIIVVTNLTKDSIRRNAHPEYMRWFMDQALPAGSTLVLNADDPVSLQLGSAGQRRVSYGLKATADYQVLRSEAGQVTLSEPAGERVYPLLNDNVANVYNEAAAIAALSEFGADNVADRITGLTIDTTRYSEHHVGQLSVIGQAAKGLNPMAVSGAFRYAASWPGRKAVIVAIDDIFDNSGENICWQYDTDYEVLADAGVTQLVFAGPRHLDHVARALLAGVPGEKMSSAPSTAQAIALLRTDGIERVYVLYDVVCYSTTFVAEVVSELRRKLGS